MGAVLEQLRWQRESRHGPSGAMWYVSDVWRQPPLRLFGGIGVSGSAAYFCRRSPTSARGTHLREAGPHRCAGAVRTSRSCRRAGGRPRDRCYGAYSQAINCRAQQDLVLCTLLSRAHSGLAPPSTAVSAGWGPAPSVPPRSAGRSWRRRGAGTARTPAPALRLPRPASAARRLGGLRGWAGLGCAAPLSAEGA